MFRSLTKTLNFAVLATYVAFSCLGSAVHQWTHHPFGTVCTTCNPAGDSHGGCCDEMPDSGSILSGDAASDDSTSRFRRGEHACRGHAAPSVCCSAVSGPAVSGPAVCPSTTGPRESQSENTIREPRLAAKRHVCDLCVQLSLLMQSWWVTPCDLAVGPSASDGVIEIFSSDRVVDPFMARSRAPPRDLSMS